MCLKPFAFMTLENDKILQSGKLYNYEQWTNDKFFNSEVKALE